MFRSRMHLGRLLTIWKTNQWVCNSVLRVTPKSVIFEMSVRVVLSGVMTPRRLDLDNKAELPYNLLLQEVSFNLFWKTN